MIKTKMILFWITEHQQHADQRMNNAVQTGRKLKMPKITDALVLHQSLEFIE